MDKSGFLEALVLCIVRCALEAYFQSTKKAAQGGSMQYCVQY